MTSSDGRTRGKTHVEEAPYGTYSPRKRGSRVLEIIRSGDERGMNQADRREFLAWLKRSPDNIAEVLRLTEVEGKLSQQHLEDHILEIEDSNVIELDLPPGARANNDDQFGDLDSEEEADERMNKRTPMFWKFAAVLAIVLVSLLSFMVKTHWLDGSEQTGPSQWQQMTLADGSVVHLDARTRLKVDFSASRRIVRLQQGQAVFEVTKNPSRPFTVSTNVVDSTAVGTRFSVSVDSGVTTTVSEGIVKVTPHGDYDYNDPVMLKAGDELHVTDSGLTQQSSANVVRVDAEAKLDWANGWWATRDRTIGEAVLEFNRRNAIQIEIMDAKIAERKMDLNRFRVDQPESFIRAIAQSAGPSAHLDRSGHKVRLSTKRE